MIGKGDPLNADTFRFHVGNFSCIVLQDAAPIYALETLFANVPKRQYGPLLRSCGEDPENIILPYTSLLIDAGRELLLVDTGTGSLAGKEGGRLLDNLRAEGIDPHDIEIVVISHAHPDHVGGILTADDKLAFPNARYIIFRQEWDFWMSNPNLDGLLVDDASKQGMLSSARNSLSRIEERVDRLREDTEILPGITAIQAFGHTPGHMAVEVTSAGDELLFVADALLHPLNLQFPHARAVFDHQPEAMVATRLRLLQQAAKKNCMVSATHFAFPGLGRVVSEETGWQWRPISTVNQGKSA